MEHSPALKSLLFDIRQHPAFEEFQRAVEAPRLPQFRQLRGDTLETMGAKTVFASGQMDQHDRWIHLLTGQVPERENETSQQEKS